jgi:hypothetical protein
MSIKLMGEKSVQRIYEYADIFIVNLLKRLQQNLPKNVQLKKENIIIRLKRGTVYYNIIVVRRKTLKGGKHGRKTTRKHNKDAYPHESYGCPDKANERLVR